MSRNLQPRKVPPRRIVAWLYEALAIATANWWMAVVTIIPTLLLATQTPSWLLMFTLPLAVTILLSFFCVLAHSHDTRKAKWSLLQHAIPGIAKILAYVLALETMASLIYGLGFNASASIAEGFIHAGAKLSEFTPGQLGMLILSCGWLLMPAGTFFLMPLVLVFGAPFNFAYHLSRNGFDNNQWLLLVSFVGAVLSLVLGAIHGLTVIAILPITGAFLYVAYRDVFMHKAEPNPQPVALASSVGDPALN